MFGVGFIAGWFVGQLQQQHSPVSAAAEVINATGKSNSARLHRQPPVYQSSYDVLFEVFLPAANSMIVSAAASCRNSQVAR